MKTLLMMFLTLLALAISQLSGARPGNGDELQLRGGHDMSHDRAAHQATLLASGRVLITGGCGGASCGQRHAATEIYDPDSRGLVSAMPMSVPRASHNAIRLKDGRVLITGGWSQRGVLASAEVFDPDVQRFTVIADMVAARAGHRAVMLDDGKVLIVGGERATHMSLASTEIFDPATNAFMPAGEMSALRSSHVAVRLVDGRVLIAGGRSGKGELLRSAEIFDPATGRFEPAGNLLTARHKQAAVLLDDGRVLVIGGSNERDYDGLLATTEIFDPANGRFSRGPDLHAARHKIVDAVVKLPSGKVLVAGGSRHPEIFDPAMQMFSKLRHALQGELMFATATLLNNGEVLVTGGYDERIRPQEATWLVDVD